MITIQFIKVDDIPEVVRLHRMVLNDGISATMGDKFLSVCYNNLVERQLGFCLVAKEDSRTVGWVVGLAPGALWKIWFNELKTKNLQFFWEIFLSSIKNFSYFKEFLLNRRELPKSIELYFIGVSNKEQGKGIGTKLIRRFNKELQKRGELGYFLATWSKKAEKFYLKEGLIRLSETIYFGKRTSFMWKQLKSHDKIS